MTSAWLLPATHAPAHHCLLSSLCSFSPDLIDAWTRLCALTNTPCIVTAPRASSHSAALQSFLKVLGVKNASYLFTRSWFCRSEELQVRAAVGARGA